MLDYTCKYFGSREPKKAVIFMHGYTKDKNELMYLSDRYKDILPNTIFYAPSGPEKCELPEDWVLQQWFSLMGTDPEGRRKYKENFREFYSKMAKDVAEVEPLVNEFIDFVKDKHGLKDEDIALMSFSQGTHTSLYSLLRRKNAVAGLVACAGGLLGENELPEALKSKPPVMVLHGVDDEYVYHGSADMIEEVLTSYGVEVTKHKLAGLTHVINDEEIKLAGDFLKAKLRV